MITLHRLIVKIYVVLIINDRIVDGSRSFPVVHAGFFCLALCRRSCCCSIQRNRTPWRILCAQFLGMLLDTTTVLVHFAAVFLEDLQCSRRKQDSVIESLVM